MRCICAQVCKDPAADQSVEVAKLRRQIGSIDADITLVNKRLEELQGCVLLPLLYCIGKCERGKMLRLNLDVTFRVDDFSYKKLFHRRSYAKVMPILQILERFCKKSQKFMFVNFANN